PTPRGPWTEHPQSPLVHDVIGGRCAGRPFLREGRLTRAAQNGSLTYGGSMQLREIVQLDAETCVERRAGDVAPDWTRGIGGTHTFNVDGDIAVIDAFRTRWSF